MIRTNVAVNAVQGIHSSPTSLGKTSFVKMYNDLCQIKVTSSHLHFFFAFVAYLNN